MLIMEASSELLKACQQGDRKAQQALYGLLFQGMMGMCYRYFANREDRTALVNMAMFKVFRSIEKQLPQGDIKAWSGRIMMNTIIDEYRKNKTFHETIMHTNEEEVLHRLSDEEAEKFERDVLPEEAEAMLLRLPEATRLVFNLYAIEGFAHQEIAAQLGISAGTSKWHVNKAREILKSLMTQNRG